MGTGTNYRGPVGIRADYVAYVTVFLSSNHYLSFVESNPFRPNPKHSATVSQSFRFSVKIYRLSALA